MNQKPTKFEQKVYNIVSKIPKGEARTYQWVAKKIGRPKSARAVGNALNKNRFTNVPCHRVIRKYGSVGGFAKGTPIKRKLLRSEGYKC